MNVREGEQAKVWFRSERFYIVEGEYYFSTREGVEIGPFETKPEVEKAVDYFIEIKQLLRNKKSEALSQVA